MKSSTFCWDGGPPVSRRDFEEVREVARGAFGRVKEVIFRPAGGDSHRRLGLSVSLLCVVCPFFVVSQGRALVQRGSILR